jgi:hypothetical protein
MSIELLYFLFSLATVGLVCFHATNMLSFRYKKTTLLGKTYIPDSREFRVLSKYSNNYSLSIVLLVFLITIINLGYSIKNVLIPTDRSDALLKVGLATLLLIVIFVATYTSLRKQYGNSNVKNVDTKNEDDW